MLANLHRALLNHALSGEERVVEQRQGLPFRRWQVMRAITDCQSVVVTNDRENAQTDIEIEIANDLAQQGNVQSILLTIIEEIRTDELEQFAGHRGNSARIMQTICLLQPLCYPTVRSNIGREVGRIDILRSRDKYNVHMFIIQ